MQITIIISFVLIFCTSCHKDAENIDCKVAAIDLTSKIIGFNVTDYHHHLLTIDLGDEICIITRNRVRILPYDSLTKTYELVADIGGVVVNEFDTIIQLENSFYRFFPSQQRLQFIYTPPFTIHDFCVTPNHGIGYICGNVFVENPKFNYFYFYKNENVTLFEYADLIYQHKNPYYYFQTFFNNDSLNLFLHIGSLNRTDVGIYYNVDLNSVKVIDSLNYSFKRSIRIIKAKDFRNLDIIYENGSESAFFSTLDFKNKNESNIFQLKNNAWYNSIYSYDNEYISVAYKAGISNSIPTLQLVNWKENKTIFKIPTPEEYLFQLGKICHFKDEYVALTGTNQKKAILLDNNGCLKYNLNFKNVTKSCIYNDDKIIVTLNNSGEVELVQLQK